MPAQATETAKRQAVCFATGMRVLGVLAGCALLGGCAAAPQAPTGLTTPQPAAPQAVLVQIPAADWASPVQPALTGAQLAAAAAPSITGMPMPDHIAVEGPTVILSGSTQSQLTSPSGSVSSGAFSYALNITINR